MCSNVSSDSTAYGMEPSSLLHSNRCISTEIDEPQEVICLSIFCSDLKGTEEGVTGKSAKNDYNNTCLAISSLVSGSNEVINPLVKGNSLRLVAWTISAISYWNQEFQSRLPYSSAVRDNLELFQITPGVLRDKLIHFVAM